MVERISTTPPVPLCSKATTSRETYFSRNLDPAMSASGRQIDDDNYELSASTVRTQPLEYGRSFNNKMERNHGCSAQLNCSKGLGTSRNSPSSGLSERTLVRLDDRGII